MRYVVDSEILVYTQWGMSNKLDHFRFARIANNILQCRRLQAEDKEIVNIELTG